MKLPIKLSDKSREPIYHQIENQLKALIAGGQLMAGSALPSIRVLSKDLGVSVITTRRAYQNLETQGFIKTYQGKGTFVANIDPTLKEDVRKSTVEKAITNAIDIALSYDYTIDQTEELFKEIITTKKGEYK